MSPDLKLYVSAKGLKGKYDSSLAKRNEATELHAPIVACTRVLMYSLLHRFHVGYFQHTHYGNNRIRKQAPIEAVKPLIT
mmetsp:Transcript_29050/g.35908  ORF Transcript_29050/g.35908 Transcript_29050/m.35908 type:complete len:80 (+) Transcript_29050:1153-1392(+)